MKKLVPIVFYSIVLTSVLIGCKSTIADTAKSENESWVLQMFSDRDMKTSYDTDNAVIITLSDEGSASNDDSVTIEKNTITISQEGAYIITGKLSQGQLIVDANKTDKLQIILDNVQLYCSNSAPVYIKQADKVFLTMADGSKNIISATGEFVSVDDNNIDAAIFSKEDLTLNGNGSLVIVSENGNGIASKDDMIITGGIYEITAKGHGLEAKDSIRISDGSFKIVSDKDGMHSENKDDTALGFVYIENGQFEMATQTDGIDAGAWVSIKNGDFNITAGGGSENTSIKSNNEMFPNERGRTQQAEEEPAVSVKGIKSDGPIEIYEGTFQLDCIDDAIHSNENVLISNGSFYIVTGDDGIHGNSNVTIDGGSIQIAKSYEGIEGKSVVITGGTIQLTASDDGLNGASEDNALNGRQQQADENTYIKITGGTIYINAGGDGIDSNGDIMVSGGKIYVSGGANGGNSALDYDGNAVISGGVAVAAGGMNMAQSFGDYSTQGVILVNFSKMQTGAIVLTDKDKNILAEYTPEKQYQSVVISAPDIVQGEVYTVTAGDEIQTIEMSSLIYGDSGNKRGGGQKPPSGDIERPSGNGNAGKPSGAPPVLPDDANTAQY